jgi:integrase
MAKANKTEFVLPIGATHYPAARNRQPEPIPKGISIRSATSVQIEFMWDGRRQTESLPGEPTEENVRAAAAKREVVLTAIRRDRFVYENEFPNSRRVEKARREAGRVHQESQATMADLFDAWAERYAKEHPHAHNTLNTHREVIRSRLAPALGRYRPSELTKDLTVNFRHDLHKEGLSENRISNIFTPLRGTLDLAVERGLIAQNPALSMTPTKPKHSTKVVLDAGGDPSFDEPFPDSLDPAYIKAAKNAEPLGADERKNVLSQMSGQTRNIFLFAFWTGLRTGELIALRWCDVSKDGRRIVVRLSYSKDVFTTTKGRRARWVDLTGPAIAALKAQRGLTGQAEKWVFHNPRIADRWQNSERIRVQWKNAVKAAGVRYRKPYQTRHTYASLMVSAGESPEWVAEQMGHLDGRLVAEVYGRWMRPSKVQPGRAAAEMYAEEWEEAESFVSREDPLPTHAQTAEEDVELGLLDEDDDEEGE